MNTGLCDGLLTKRTVDCNNAEPPKGGEGMGAGGGAPAQK
jgi:hypothetical protein